MTPLTVRPLNPMEWLGVPAVACAVASFAFAIPARLFGLSPPEPVFALAAAFAWAVIRPSVLPPFVLLLLGLFLDLLWGGPLGLWPICLLTVYAAVLFVQRTLSQFEFFGQWIAYAIACAIALGAGWVLASIRAGVLVDLAALAWQYLATVLLFPIAFVLIERYQGADVRFR